MKTWPFKKLKSSELHRSSSFFWMMQTHCHHHHVWEVLPCFFFFLLQCFLLLMFSVLNWSDLHVRALLMNLRWDIQMKYSTTAKIRTLSSVCCLYLLKWSEFEQTADPDDPSPCLHAELQHAGHFFFLD